MRKTFDDFLLDLAQGQLRNTAAADTAHSGTIDPDYHEHLLRYTNQGLVDLTTRKKLFEDTKVLTFVPDQNIYPLDTTDVGDFFRMVRVYEIVTSDERRHTPKTNPHITMPNPETIRFSDQFMEFYETAVDIRFQVLHPIVEIDGEINLPNHLFEVLALYVSGLYLSHMGGEEHKARGDSYYGLYLKKIDDDTLDNSSGTSEVTDDDTRFYDRGFV